MPDEKLTIAKTTLPAELWHRARAAGLVLNLSASEMVVVALRTWLALSEEERRASAVRP